MTEAKETDIALACFHDAAIAAVVLDADGKVRQMNRAFATFMDLPTTDPAQITDDIFHPGDLETIATTIKGCHAGQPWQGCDGRLVTKIGAIRKGHLMMTKLASTGQGLILLQVIPSKRGSYEQTPAAKAPDQQPDTGAASIARNVALEITATFKSLLRAQQILLSAANDTPQATNSNPQLAQLAQVTKITAQCNNLMASWFKNGTVGQATSGSVDLNQLVQDLAGILATKAQPLGITLLWDLDRDIPQWVATDKAKITAVLFTLINHTMDFSQGGKIRLAINAVSNGLHFTISDTGRQIQESQLVHLLGPYDPSQATSRNHESHLHLSLVKALVTALGGTLVAQVNANEGLVFSFTLTAKSIVADPVAITATTNPAARSCVLIVDDDATTRETLGSQIVKLGYEVVYACDGLDGLQKCDPQTIDLIITDVSMPKLNGLQMLRAIHKASPAIPAIVVSGRPDTQAAAHKLGALFFAKPYNIPNLLNMIQELLKVAA